MTDEMRETTVDEDYIAKLQELKQSTVSRDEYDRVRADNKKLLDAVFSGAPSPVEQPKEEKEVVDIQALRNELYGGRFEGTDLDYMTKTLKLRRAIMESGGRDPAVSTGAKTEATEADYENCEAVCNILQECVDYAQGDPALFRAEILRRTRKK